MGNKQATQPADELLDTHWDGHRPLDVGGPEKYEPHERKAYIFVTTDGVRLAVDLLLPPNLPKGSKIPCVLHQARYYRSYEIVWPLKYLVNRGCPVDFLHGSCKKMLLRTGFAVLSVDVRGTGASTGSQDFPFQPQEADDAYALMDHIIEQDWCDGRIVLWGASYDAGAAARAAARCHPSVRALVTSTLFGDPFREFMPGGIMNSASLGSWSEVNNALDSGMRDVSRIAPYLIGVSKPGNAKAVEEAVQAHTGNFQLMKAAKQVRAIDTKVHIANGEDHCLEELDLEQTRTFQNIADSGVPWLNLSGWYCPTGTITLRTFSAYRKPGWRYIVGPWNHMFQHYRMAGKTGPTDFDVHGEIARFLKINVLENANESGSSIQAAAANLEPELHYFTGGVGRWSATNTWPPEHVCKRALHLGASGNLLWDEQDSQLECALEGIPLPPKPAQPDSFCLWEGHSRHNSITQISPPIKSYKWIGGEGWDAAGLSLLFATPSLEAPLEICGNAILALELQTSDDPDPALDADIFAYLVELKSLSDPVEPVYVTEGCFRASQGAEVEPPWYAMRADTQGSPHEPWHSFKEQDKEMLPASGKATVKFAMLPTAWQFEVGSRVGLALCSADKHFDPNPEVGSQKLPSILTGVSRLYLPVANHTNPN